MSSRVEAQAHPPGLHRDLGLSDEEYERVVNLLGRAPNRAELAMFAVMWSEHCSYKSSRMHLESLPSEGPQVLMGPGEGAGVVGVGEVAVAFRIESHNHPSFIEPFQGAATGVGGIVRDILSVGARPIALFDSLRFGPLPVESRVEPEIAERNRSLFEGVVSGISSYGNCIGVPTVGGEVSFENCYSGNPLVNVMCIGVAPVKRIRRARAEGAGNAVVLLGSKTGRDGIGGVSVLASASFDSSGNGRKADDKRPSVQVGDPFTEKLLIEACLELMDAGLVVGIQDLGGAGLSCATSETAAKAGTGMRVDIGRVPRRETGMEPFEVLTSESQERMLIVINPVDMDKIRSVCDRWGLDASVIGEVMEGSRLVVAQDRATVADVPAAALGDGPAYDRPSIKPEWMDRLKNEDVDIPPSDLAAAVKTIVHSPNVASKRWVWRQYDHQVMLGTVVGPGADAAVLRIPGASERIAATTDGNARYGQLDPRLGGGHAVAEAFRNLSAVGASPIALTNCLNFGNPERPEVMWQFKESVAGIAEAAAALLTPVTGGNVSFYNETGGRAIYPTPIIGMIGVLDPAVRVPGIGFRNEGDQILLLGRTLPELGGSEYARTILGKVAGRPPELDLDREAALGAVLRSLIGENLLNSAHDCSEGGLAVALAESCIASPDGLGARISARTDLEPYQWLFSETASRAVVSCAPKSVGRVEEMAAAEGVDARAVGIVGGTELLIQTISIPVSDLQRGFEEAIPGAMGYASDDLG